MSVSAAPEGNAFMRHERTRVERVQQVGPVEEFDHVATFRCTKCGRTEDEAFDPAVERG